MRKLVRHLGGSCSVAAVAFLLSGVVLGHASQPGPNSSAQPDVFASVHASLNDAADRTLAAALADKPWMKSAEADASAESASSVADPVTRLRTAVERVRRLRPAIEPILREEGVPPELSAVVLVESGGLTTALSPKGARGVWQIMPDTARRYGLAVSPVLDERLDVTKSTRAAARYLRHLHQQFGDWQLAFAAYNAGEQAVGRAMRRAGQKDFSAIERALPRETRDYVPGVLAAMKRLQGRDYITPARVLYAPAEPGY